MKEQHDPKARRRGRGEGSIFKRPDGRWCAIVYIGYSAGKLKRKYLYAATRASVRDKLTDALAKKKRGELFASERLTVEKFLCVWLKESVTPNVREKTRVHYEYICNQHLIPSIGRRPLNKLAPPEIQSMLNEKAATLSPGTRRQILVALRRALKIALRWDLISRNVATLVDAPKLAAREVLTYTPDQIETFLSAVAGDPLECLYLIAAGIGLRQGELIGLRWTDVDLDAASIQVRSAIQRQRGTLERTELKTDRARRSLPIPDSIVAALRRHKTAQLERRILVAGAWKEQGLVFTSSIGTALEPANLTRHYDSVIAGINKREKKAAEAESRKPVEFPRLKFHSLRHYSASAMLRAGVPARVAADILGHSSTRLTLDTYSHVIEESKRAAVQHIEAVIRKK